MSQIVIYFIGLISHITLEPVGNEAPRQIAVIVKATDHDAELVVPVGAVIPTTSTKVFAITATVGGKNYYDIAGHNIEILGLPIGAPTTFTSAFSNYVPSLKQVTDGKTPADDVTKEKFNNGYVRSIVVLNGGTLDVSGWYEYKGKNYNYSEACVASEIKYTAPVVGTAVEIVSDDGRRLRIAAGTEIRIHNLPTMQGVPAHYEHKRYLLNDATTIGTWMASTINKCGKKPIYVPGKGGTIECSNSQFP